MDSTTPLNVLIWLAVIATIVGFGSGVGTAYVIRGVLRDLRCPHSDLRPIYGDQINHVGGYRLKCRRCSRFLDGPVELAKARAGEPR